jgi:hypothetical protein
MRNAWKSYAVEETGAVTVDWVVLTAALVGLGIAVMAVLTGGLRQQSGDVRDMMQRDDLILTRFARAVEETGVLGALFGEDFSTGPGRWSGGPVVDAEGFGEILQIGPNGRVSMSVDVPPGAASATVAFDLIGANDLSGVSAIISIDDRDVAIYTDDHGNITTSEPATSGITVTRDQQYTNSHMGAGDVGADSRARYTLTIDDPAAQFSVAVRSTSDRPLSEEYFAIDDVDVRAD